MTIHVKDNLDAEVGVNWSEVAKRLREVRGTVPQIEFGETLGVAQNVVSRYERGRVRPPVEYLVAVSRKASVTLDWLILGQEPKSRGKREQAQRRQVE